VFKLDLAKGPLPMDETLLCSGFALFCIPMYMDKLGLLLWLSVV
jgi:hypothetical protein